MNPDEIRRAVCAATELSGYCRSCGNVFPYGNAGEIGDAPPIECQCGRSDLFVYDGEGNEHDPEASDNENDNV